MRGAERAAATSAVVLLGNVLERLLKFLVIFFLARHLGARDFGLYAFVFAFVEMFSVLTDLGLHSVLVREVARDPAAAPRLVGNALLLKGLLSLLALALSWGSAAWLDYPPATRWLVFLASFILLLSFRISSFRMVFDAPFQAELAMGWPVFLGGLSEVLSAGAVLLAIALGWGLPALIALQVAAYLPGFAALLAVFWRRFRPALAPDLALWGSLLLSAAPVALANLFLIAYPRAAILMLSWMKGEESVGFYAAAHKLTGSLGVLPLAVSASVLPLVARLYREGSPELGKFYRMSLHASLAVALPISVALSLLAGPVISLLYGPAFLPSAPVLALLAWSVPFHFTLYVVGAVAVAIDRQSLFLAQAAGLAILNALLNLLLIPRWDYLGACWAVLLAEGALSLLCLAALRPHVGGISPVVPLKYLGASLLLGVALLLPLPIVYRLALGLIAYGAGLFALRAFPPEEVALFRSLLRRGPRAAAASRWSG